MREIKIEIIRLRGNGFRLVLDLFETISVGTGMRAQIPGGAILTMGGSPTALLGQDGCPVQLTMDLPDEDPATLDIISEWFRGKMSSRPDAKVTVQGKECRFEKGELQELLETNED
jgi:hypothetical protein